MPTVTVPRADVTVEQVSAVLRRELGSRYRVTPSMMAAAFGKEGPGDAPRFSLPQTGLSGQTSELSLTGIAPRSV